MGHNLECRYIKCSIANSNAHLNVEHNRICLFIGFLRQMFTIINQIFLGNLDIHSQIKCPNNENKQDLGKTVY